MFLIKRRSAQRLSTSCRIRRCCSGERLPTLTTADQKKQFGPFVSDYAVIYGYSQQISETRRWTLVCARWWTQRQCDPRPAGYMTQREPLRQANGALGVLSQQLQECEKCEPMPRCGAR
ncbi:DUF3053 domain-containing protein [Klebsiella pneumoniae]|nr:DUF3053 domain-containing protein [Klebsiella pneumoniae]